MGALQRDNVVCGERSDGVGGEAEGSAWVTEPAGGAGGAGAGREGGVGRGVKGV